MSTTHLGSKVRAKRRSRNLSQAELARRLEISPSYLNLIEHDQRPLTAALLIKLAQEFGLELSDFAVDDDRRLAAHLLEAFSDPVFEDHPLNSAEVRELASDAPAIARAVLALYDQFQRARASLVELAEHSYSHQETLAPRLTETLPSEEVNEFIQRHMNCFRELEDEAERLWVDARLKRGARFAGMADWLEGQGYRVELSAGDRRVVRRFDRQRRLISLSEALPPSSRNFQLAVQIALCCHHALLERLTEDDEGLSTPSSRTLARLVLANYFAGAVLMPYEHFLRSAVSQRYDIELLANRFGTSFEQVCHRLTTLRRPQAEGVAFHMLRVDIAGNIS
ncbi:MAG: ImmA/IrrE family metallo-endopeptidase, partial [Myxococcales bacterium]|nr:ImmA/IrrE family metallo-endopeptidase [Myxococcales bacterium]